MGINAIDISQIIVNSREKINFKILLLKNIAFFMGIILFGNLAAFNLLHMPLSIGTWMAAASVGIFKFLIDARISIKRKEKANKQLTSIVSFLRNEGIDVTRLKLKKSKLGTKKVNFIHGSYGSSCITENVIIFRDNQKQLKVLRQVRSELLMKIREPNNQDIIDGSYVEIIENSEKAEKILGKMNRGERNK